VEFRYVPNAVMGILRVDLSFTDCRQPLAIVSGKAPVKIDPKSEDRPEV